LSVRVVEEGGECGGEEKKAGFPFARPHLHVLLRKRDPLGAPEHDLVREARISRG